MQVENIQNQPQNLPAIQQALPVMQQEIPAPQPPLNQGNIAVAPQIQAHALDPTAPKNLPLDRALVPYNANQINKEDEHSAAGEFDFDLAELVAEFQEDNDGEADMLLAATQMERNPVSTKMQTTMMIRKSSPKVGATPTFQNCRIGHIGAINIHIHKH